MAFDLNIADSGENKFKQKMKEKSRRQTIL